MRTMMALVLVVAVGCGKSKPTEEGSRSEGGVPEDWTHKELAEHFAKKKAGLRMIATTAGTFRGPAVYFVAEDSDITDEDGAKAAVEAKAKTIAYCQIRKTAQEAKDEAGTRGDKAFSSGRFYFNGSPEFLSHVRRFLP
jgi:hypothetical protein